MGEIDYRYVLSLLERHGYKDYIGLEYKPRSSTVEGLKWISRFGYSL
jgi:hydroxypyruvate isomerase